MSRQIKEKVFSIINEENPLPKAIQLLKEQPEGKDAEFMKEVVLRILETLHDWDSIRQCLKKWKTFISWGNDFLKRMYWRIGENSNSPNFSDCDRIDEEIVRTSKLYWQKMSPRNEKSRINHGLIKDYLSVGANTKPEFVFEQMPEKKPTPKETVTLRNSQRKFTFDPRNIEASMEDTLRRQTFLNTGRVEPVAHVINHTWKFEPLQPRSSLFHSQPEEKKPEEIKAPKNQVIHELSFSNNKSSTKNSRPVTQPQSNSTTLLNKLQKNPKEADSDLSFSLSPLKTKKLPTKTEPSDLLDWSFKSSVKPKLNQSNILDFEPIIQKNNRTSIGTDFNQLYPRQTRQLLERNGHYKLPAVNRLFQAYKKKIKPKGTIEYFLDALELNK